MTIPANQDFLTAVLSIVETSLESVKKVEAVVKAIKEVRGSGKFDAFRQVTLGYMNTSSPTKASLIVLRKKILSLGVMTFPDLEQRKAFNELVEAEYERTLKNVNG